MLGTSAGVEKLEDLNMGNPDQPSTVQAVVDWYGPIRFSEDGRTVGGERTAPTARNGAQRSQFSRIASAGT